MNSQQLDEEAVFQIARVLPDTDNRKIYLNQVCAGDQALRERVEALLGVYDQEQSFLKSNHSEKATTDRSPVTETCGDQIGRFKLLQKIGEGGFGLVFMSEQSRPVRRKVALKIIKPGMDTKAVVARFEAERQALAMMDHPNIARVLDGGATDSGRPYFVMELVKGVPITDYCDQNQLPARERLELFVNVCQAVQHAHQKGIIHRDLKPSNILVTLHDGRPMVKVIDFGVAKAINQQLTEKTLFTAYGQMVGTPQYMSPEQAEMSGLDVDTRSDIYSLGVLLYELLTGTTPLESARLRTAGYAEMQRLIREEEPPKPSTRLSSTGEQLTMIAKHRSVSPEQLQRVVRGDLDWIVMRALEKDRGRRYETATSMADDVQRYLTDEPVEARPPSSGYRLRKFIRRNRGLMATLSVGALLLFVTTAAISWFAWETVEAKRELAANLEKLQSVAKDWATEEVLTGNAKRSFAAIELARAARVSNDWLEVLRAQSLCDQGKYGDATQILEGIVDSDDVDARYACRYLLALASIYDGNDPNYIASMNKARELSDNVGPHASWFKAAAESVADVDRAARAIDDLSEKRLRPAYLLTRATIRATQGIQRRDFSQIDAAIMDVKYAQAFAGKTRAIQNSELLVQLAGHETATLLQDPDRQDFHLAAIAKLLANADKLVDSPWTAATVCEASERLDDRETWVNVAQSFDWGNTIFVEYPAAYLYEQWPASVALQNFDEFKFDFGNPYAQIARAHMLADLPNNRQRLTSIYNDINKSSSSFQTRYRSLVILALIGDPVRLRDEARGLLDSKCEDISFWGMRDGLRVLAGEDLEALPDATSEMYRACAVYYAIGIKYLAEGNRGLAKENFQECKNTGNFGWYEYNWSKAFLAKFDDPSWRLWLDADKEN